MNSTQELTQALIECGRRLRGAEASWNLEHGHDGFEVVVFTQPIEHLAVRSYGDPRPFGVIRCGFFPTIDEALGAAVEMCARVVRDRNL